MSQYVGLRNRRKVDNFHERSFATIFNLEVTNILEDTFIRLRSGYKRGQFETSSDLITIILVLLLLSPFTFSQKHRS
jgi:hypothetical protein